MTKFDLFSLCVAGITALFNLIAVAFVGIQVRQAAKQARFAAEAQQAEWARQKKAATIDFITSTMELNQQLVSGAPFLERDPERAKELMKAAEKDPGAEATIRAYLDYMEDIAVGVNEGVLDIGTVNRMSGGRIIALARNCAPYIERRRKEIQSRTLYCELVQLATDLRAHRAAIGYGNLQMSAPDRADREPDRG